MVTIIVLTRAPYIPMREIIIHIIINFLPAHAVDIDQYPIDTAKIGCVDLEIYVLLTDFRVIQYCSGKMMMWKLQWAASYPIT